MPVLEAHGICKTVGSGRAARRVLDGVSLKVEADEVVAVLGRSGSGKSTLLHLLGALEPARRAQRAIATATTRCCPLEAVGSEYNSERTVCRSAERAWAVEGGLGACAWRPGSDHLTHLASACRAGTLNPSNRTGSPGGLRLSVGYVGPVPSTHRRASLVEHAPQNAMDDPDEIERFWPRSFAVAS